MKYLFFCICILFSGVISNAQALKFISPDHRLIQYTGRIDYRNPKELKFSYPGTSIKIKFEGPVINLHLSNYSGEEYREKGNLYNVIIDQEAPKIIRVTDSSQVFKFEVEDGTHTIEIFKRTESLVGAGIFKGVEIQKGKKLLPINTPQRKIEFIGNSITCGYGNEGDSATCPFSPDTENNYRAYGAITARNLDADYMAVAYSGKGVAQNYDLGNRTIPAVYDKIFPDSLYGDPDWDFKKWKPDVVVINLGTNDFAHGIPDSIQFVNTYHHFLKHVRSKYPDAEIFCIQGSMIRDGWPKGVKSLTSISNYMETAVELFKKDSDSKIHTFYLSIAGSGDFGCDSHPNVRRHQIMAEELTAELKRKLNW